MIFSAKDFTICNIESYIPLADKREVWSMNAVVHRGGSSWPESDMINNLYKLLPLLAVGLLPASQLPAQVVYSGDQNIVMGSYAYSSPFNFWNSASTLKIDFNLDGTPDMAVFRGFTVFTLVGVGGLNGGEFSKTAANVSRAWMVGESIDSTAIWAGGSSFGELNGGSIGPNPQYWSSYSQRGYIGARFPLLDGLHYGWIDYQSEPNANSGTVFGWAWETRPDVAIVAGDRGPGAVPEPSTYALAGVAVLGGLIAWRRRGSGRI